MGNSSTICPAYHADESYPVSRATLGSKRKVQESEIVNQMWWRAAQFNDSLLPSVRKLQRYDRDRLFSLIKGGKEGAHVEYQHQCQRMEDETMKGNRQETVGKYILSELQKKYQLLVESRLQMTHKVQAEVQAKRQKSTNFKGSSATSKEKKKVCSKI